MSEHLLDGSEVCAPVQEVRCERVPERVRMHAALHLRQADPDAQTPAHIGGPEPASGLREEERGLFEDP